MGRVMQGLSGSQPDGPARWRWGVALVVLSGVGGLTWYFVHANSNVGTAFAQAPVVVPETATDADSLRQALPLVTSAPALPPVGHSASNQGPAQNNASLFQRDPFANAPRPQAVRTQAHSPGGTRDPFTPVQPEPTPAAGPWTRAEHAPEMPVRRHPTTPAAPHLPAPLLAAPRDLAASEPLPAAAGIPAAAPIQQVQQTEPATTQDLFLAPPVDSAAPVQPGLTPPTAAAATPDIFATQEPLPPANTPAANPVPATSNPFAQLAPPIEARMEATVESSNPVFPSAPAANPFPAEPAPRESFFPQTPTATPPLAPVIPDAYQPQPIAEPPTFNNQPQPLESTNRPLLTSPPATAVSSSEPAMAEEQVYKVQPGDNYWSISKAFYGSGRYFGALAQYNSHRIPAPEKMKPGMIVLVPDALVLHRQFPKLAGPDPTQVKPAELSGFFVDAQGHPAYRVGQNDTLGGIAQMHLGRVTRAEQVYQLNKDRIRDPNNLKIGTVLRLPADASQVQVAGEGATYR